MKRIQILQTQSSQPCLHRKNHLERFTNSWHSGPPRPINSWGWVSGISILKRPPGIQCADTLENLCFWGFPTKRKHSRWELNGSGGGSSHLPCGRLVRNAEPQVPFQSHHIRILGQPWLGWFSGLSAKDHQFDSLSGHMPGLRARSWLGGLWEATN